MFASAPLRIAIATIAGFSILIGIMLVVRPDMVMHVVHMIMG